LEDAKDLVFAALLPDQQHALLRLAEHDLVRSHSGFALRNTVQLNFDSSAATRAHLAGRASQSGGAHVLDSNNGTSLHRLQTGFQQQLLKKRIADLNIRTLRFRAFAEFLARHGGAMNAVASGFGADINYGIALSRSPSIKNLVAADQSKSERVHQRVAGVTRLKLHLAAQVRDSETVAVRSHARDDALHYRMVLVNFRLRGGGAHPRLCSAGALARVGSLNRPKAQRVHHRDRPRSHGKNIAQNSADARGRSLKWLDKRRMIVRLDLECASPAVADVDDAGILARPLHHQFAARGKTLQVNTRRFIGAVFAPHHAEDAEFGPRGFASAKALFDFFEFFRSQAVFPDHLRRNGNRNDRRGGHQGILIVASPPTFRMRNCLCRADTLVRCL